MTTPQSPTLVSLEEFLARHQLALRLLAQVGATTPNGHIVVEADGYRGDMQILNSPHAFCVIIDVDPVNHKNPKGT